MTINNHVIEQIALLNESYKRK